LLFLRLFLLNGTRVRFVLTQKESAILYYIQKKLGIGTVKHFPQGKSGNKNDFYRLIVDNPSHILILAFLFNGNLALTHRIQQLSLWVKALNNRFGSNTILFINTAVSVTLQDAWLSGFTLFFFLLLKSTTNHEQKKKKN
jgi:hypothetical protein